MEKRKLGVALSKLSPEHLNKALEIVAQNNLNFQANAEEVELDIDAQVLFSTLLFVITSCWCCHIYLSLSNLMNTLLLLLLVVGFGKYTSVSPLINTLLFIISSSWLWAHMLAPLSLTSLINTPLLPLVLVVFGTYTNTTLSLSLGAQSESTLWRLKFFVKDLQKDPSRDANKNITSPNAVDNDNNIVSKRKREICDALAKTAKKRKTKPSS